MNKKYQIPDYMPKITRPYSIEEMMLRQKYIEEGMFAFVSWQWINPLVKWIGDRKCLEVMAGRGILSYALREKGIDVVSTDDYSWANKEYKEWKETVTDVIDMDAIQAVDTYGKDINVLIMSWPYMDNIAYQVIKKLYDVNPFAIVLYIGETAGGCTADQEFFEHFEEIEDDNFEDVIINYERWLGIHDRPMIGKRRKVLSPISK